MSVVIMKGWKEGLEKVSLSKLQMELLKLSLKEAKENVDALLDGKEVILDIQDDNIAKKFLYEAKQIGVEGVLDIYASEE